MDFAYDLIVEGPIATALGLIGEPAGAFFGIFGQLICDAVNGQ